MLEKTVCLRGAEAAAVFYDAEKFKRKGATPRRIKKTLFGTKVIQSLDNDAHHHRKTAFMSLMTHDNIQRLMQEVK